MHTKFDIYIFISKVTHGVGSRLAL